MTESELNQFRAERLQALLTDKFAGNKAALGRALGYSSGAFVRQMVDLERPVTEKTVAKIHDLPGCSGWMNPPKDSKIPKNPDITVRPSSSKTLNRAPVIAWARLGVELLNTPNEDVPATEYISVPEGASNVCKWVVVEQDHPAYRIRAGSKIAVDTLDGHDPEDGGLYLFQTVAGKFIIAEYRALADGSFEAIPLAGQPLDSARHGVQLVAMIKGVWW